MLPRRTLTQGEYKVVAADDKEINGIARDTMSHRLCLDEPKGAEVFTIPAPGIDLVSVAALLNTSFPSLPPHFVTPYVRGVVQYVEHIDPNSSGVRYIFYGCGFVRIQVDSPSMRGRNRALRRAAQIVVWHKRIAWRSAL